MSGLEGNEHGQGPGTVVAEDLTSRTIVDFGEQWTNYRDNPGYYGSVDLLEDLFSGLLTVADVRDSRVADIGSGTGRIVNMLLDAGAARVVAVEPSAAFRVLQANTFARADQVIYVNDRGESLPAGLDLDLVVSMGVLHHIPDPAPVVDAAFRALRPGGQMLVWLYGREGNGVYLAIVEPLRAVTKRMPHGMLAATCAVLNAALDAYILACRLIPLPMRDYMRNVLARMPRSVRKLVVYDQLNPAYAKYYTREEAESLLKTAGFIEVRLSHRHGYSWSVAGRKPL